MMSDDDNNGQMIFGDLKLPDICLTGEEKPRKNLTQETCPDRRSNPGPLHDRRTCYSLSHSGGRIFWWGIQEALSHQCLNDSFVVQVFSETIYNHHHYHHHQPSILPKGRSFTANSGTKAAVLPKAGLPPQTQESRLQFY